MRLRTPLTLLLLLTALVCAGDAAQDTQPQRFRAGIDLLTVDVAALDARGKPVEDLRPGDFTVRVNGKSRKVVSAEFITVDRATPPPARPVDALIASNVSSQNARRVVVAVDQTLITPGTLTPLLRTAAEFVGRLAPPDYAAFIGFPEPGPRLDFTTDKAAVRKAMQTISVGQAAKTVPNDFNISLWEAFMITGAESIQNKTFGAPPGPILEKVLERAILAGCNNLPIDQCKNLLYNESMTLLSEARLDGTISLRALEALLADLVPLEGPKSMIIFSAGLVADDQTKLNELGRLAALARTTISVIAVDRDRGQLTQQTNPLTSSPLADRAFELEGLEGIADRTNGTLFRGIASGAGIFEQLESELSARYLVAVEREPGDAGELKLDVEVKRRGVTLKSNKTVVTPTVNPGRSVEELLSNALSSPFTLPGLPLRMSVFTQRDVDPGKYRLRIAADIGQPGEPSGEFAIGYVLTNPGGRVVMPAAGERRTLSPGASGPSQVLHYDTALSVEPGTYALRFAVVDKEGRRGAVVQRIELPKLAPSEFGTGDLIVGNLPAEGETLAPRVEAQVTASELAGYLELYGVDGDDGVTVTLDIAEGAGSPALASQPLTLRPGAIPSSRVAAGFVPATMTPGRYVARAIVRRGDVTMKTLTRPFTIVRDPTVVSRGTPRTRGVPITTELKQRTAAYIVGVVNGLANVVAREEFELSKPDRRVTSDLLLVRYPGRQRDLIPYRDVAQVNGTPVEGREERLVDLFVKPTDLLREQARRIMLSADAHVPSAFNPMFVLGFLQSDFQSRFELTVGDAGPDWPREVKAVTFVEIGRPTLLRTGAFGDLDAPTRGIAWIEETTGRIHQTELEVGRGRSAPKMVTKFSLDDRLQVTVPVEMRTQNPDGLAKYSNYRRFGVETDAVIPVPAEPAAPPPR